MVPTWMSRYPSDAEYFIGVGGAPDTGDRQADLEHGRANALSQLASEIEVTVRSDQTFRESTSASGSSSSSVDIIVQTLTEQNLEGVELVDSFHSAKEGYWFYFRLAKRTWDEIKNHDMYALRDRVLAMIAPLSAPGVSVAERLRTYARAVALLRDSPYAGKIVVEIDGTSAVLDDLLSARLAEMVGRLNVEVSPASIRYSPGEPARVHIGVTTTEKRLLGTLPLEVRSAQAVLLGECRTGSDGSYEGNLHLAAEKAGKRPCSVALAAGAVEGADRTLLARLPRVPVEIEVLPLGVHLRLEGPRGLDAKWLTDSVASVLTQDYALAVLEAEEPTPYTLSVVVRTRSSAPNEYGIAFAYCSLSMTAIRDNTQIAALTTEEAKGAGTTEAQALRKAAAALLEDFSKDRNFAETIEILTASAWAGAS